MDNYLKIIGVIQARMNSSRLPGKVMLNLLGKPIIHHIYDRLTTCKQLDAVVISTGGYNENKEICDYAKKNNFPLYSGSETDVIDRLYKTALKFDASSIVRITADCPLVDPIIVDKLISEFLKNAEKYDIITNCNIPTFPHGLDVEVYSTKILKKLWNDISELEFRDWFSLYTRKNLKDRMLNITNNVNLSHLRLTVDYKEDFELIKLIYEEMQSNTFVLDDVLKILKQKPELLDINAKYVGFHNVDAPT